MGREVVVAQLARIVWHGLTGSPALLRIPPSCIFTQSRERHTMPPSPHSPTPLWGLNGMHEALAAVHDPAKEHCSIASGIVAPVCLLRPVFLSGPGGCCVWLLRLSIGRCPCLLDPLRKRQARPSCHVFQLERIFLSLRHVHIVFFYGLRFCAPLLDFFLELFSGLFVYFNDHRPVVGWTNREQVCSGTAVVQSDQSCVLPVVE